MTTTIELEMPPEQYHATPALSFSGMKDLAVSPLRYWHLNINPNRPEPRETPEMMFGSALHCAVLEPSKFAARYYSEITPEDFPGCLVTMDDLREWCRNRGLPTTAQNKGILVERVLANDPSAPIFDVLKLEHAKANEGKTLLSRDDWARVQSAAGALLSEPEMQRMMATGKPEVSVFTTDPETGVPLKCRMDWVAPEFTLDLKTFSQMRGKSIDRTIHDAIYYEGYHKQAYMYTYMRSLLSEDAPVLPFVIAFVESSGPHETRIKVLRPKSGGNVNIYWERARVEVRGLIDLYAECWSRFGEKPWRVTREMETLHDEDIPQFAY